MAELTVPVALQKEEEKLEIWKDVKDILSGMSKKSLEQRKEILDLDKKKDKRDQQIQQLWLKSEIGQTTKRKYLQIKNKLLTVYQKWIIKGKFFNIMSKAFTMMAKNSESWFMKIMKTLLFLAIFDPKGTILTVLVDKLKQAGLWLFDFLKKWIPILIIRMAKLFWNVLLPAVGSIGQKFMEALGFAEGGIMSKIGGFLTQFALVGIMLMGAWSKFGKFIKPLFKGLQGIGSKILSNFTLEKKAKRENWIFDKKRLVAKKAQALKDWLWEKKMRLQVWKYKVAEAAKARAEQVKGWAIEKAMAIKKFAFTKAQAMKDFIFTRAMSLKEFLMKKAMAIMNFAIQVATNPIFLIIAAITIAAALIYKFRKQLVEFFKMIGDKLFSVFEPVIKKLKPIFNGLLKVVKLVKTWVIDKIVNVFSSIKKVIGNIMNWIQTVARVGALDYGISSDKTQEKYKQTMKLRNLAKEAQNIKGDAGWVARDIIKKTATEDDFKKKSEEKNLAMQIKLLQAAIDRNSKATNKSGDKIKDNTDASKDNTNEMKKKKGLEDTPQVQNIIKQFQGITQTTQGKMGGLINNLR